MDHFCDFEKNSFIKIKSLVRERWNRVFSVYEGFLSFFRLKTLFISIFLGLGSQEFLGIVWDLVEFLGLGLGLGLNSENFGIGIGTGIEFENFWDWDWDSYFLNLGLGLGLGFIFSEPGIGIGIGISLPTPGTDIMDPNKTCIFTLILIILFNTNTRSANNVRISFFFHSDDHFFTFSTSGLNWSIFRSEIVNTRSLLIFDRYFEKSKF